MDARAVNAMNFVPKGLNFALNLTDARLRFFPLNNDVRKRC
jgi:hypothetical protein